MAGEPLPSNQLPSDQLPSNQLRYDQRPADHTPVHTADLPDTPTRDRNIVATAWVQAPPELLVLGADLPGAPEAEYKRRIGRWLLWRAGPAVGDARYLAIAVDDVGVQHSYRLQPESHDDPENGRGVNGRGVNGEGVNGEGAGPSGITHHRFRAWKEDLLGR